MIHRAMGYELTKTSPAENVSVLKQTAFSIRLDVTSDDGSLYPPKVFVMQQPPEGDPSFCCVASPVQILDYPEDAAGDPVDGVQQPYFRVSSVTIVSRSPLRLQDFIRRAEEELEILENSMDALNSLNA